MMLTAQGEATTPVAEGTSPEERSPPLGVEHGSEAEMRIIYHRIPDVLRQKMFTPNA